MASLKNEEAVDEYMQAQRSNMMAVVFKDSAGVLKTGSHQCCHSVLGDLMSGSTVLYTSTWSRGCDGKAFVEYALDKERSPWRCVLKDYKIFDGYVGFFDLDVSAQVLANLCIALRMPAERPECIKVFNAALECGFSEPEALFLMASGLRVGHYDKCTFATTYGGHFPFDEHVGVSLQKLRNGAPVFDADKTMKKDARERYPINAIWHTTGGPPSNLLIKQKAYDGSFPAYHRYYGAPVAAVTYDLSTIFKNFKEIKDTLP